jgi:hypothetical protein
MFACLPLPPYSSITRVDGISLETTSTIGLTFFAECLVQTLSKGHFALSKGFAECRKALGKEKHSAN